MINNFHDGELICLDFSYKMHQNARKRNIYLKHHYLRAVFEALPIRKQSVNFLTAAFALRDSLNKPHAIREACSTMSQNGIFLLIDIGKPDNAILRSFMSIFMKYVVPVIGGLTAGYGYKNPWSMLFKTYLKLPPNRVLISIIESNLEIIYQEEQILGGLLIILGKK